VQRSINKYHNIGDAFVHDSSLKLLDYDTVDVLEIAEFSQAEVDRCNAEYDFVFLRGSNYLHSTMEWRSTYDIVKRLKIPVIAFGIGAQAPSKGTLALSDQTKEVMRAMADHCVTMGVRGIYTADALWSIGVKNVRIIGCPTLYRRNDPENRIELPSLDTVKQMGYTLRREVSSTYSPDIVRYLSLQRESILTLAGRFDVTVMAQGEIEEKKIVFGTPEQREEAMTELANHRWFQGEDDPMRKIYRERLFYSDVVAEYDAIVKRQQLVLGYRLHGNLIALANGIPSVYFTYDSRTAEFVETFQIPAFDVYKGEPFDLDAYWDQARFEKFNRACWRGYREMKRFLDENGLANKMHADVPGKAPLQHAA